MKDVTKAKHRSMMTAKFVDWPNAGPEKWLSEWNKLMMDCKKWIPVLYATDVRFDGLGASEETNEATAQDHASSRKRVATDRDGGTSVRKRRLGGADASLDQQARRVIRWNTFLTHTSINARSIV
jgi:hypothetical protein